jgi:hypothetical protein
VAVAFAFLVCHPVGICFLRLRLRLLLLLRLLLRLQSQLPLQLSVLRCHSERSEESLYLSFRGGAERPEPKTCQAQTAQNPRQSSTSVCKRVIFNQLYLIQDQEMAIVSKSNSP